MNLYTILGLHPNASADDIKRAYRLLAKHAHPDAGGNADDMAALNEAYETLSDPERRRRYDETGRVTGADNEDALLNQIVFKAVEGAITACPDLKIVDVLAVAIDALKKDIDGIKQQQENFAKQALRYESAIERIEGEAGKLHGMLRAQADHLHRRTGEADPIISRLNRAIAEIKKYRYRCDAAPNWGLQFAGVSGIGQQQAGLGGLSAQR